MTNIDPTAGGESIDWNLRATGPVLSAHIDEKVAESDGNDPLLNDFSVAMGHLLAKRIGEQGVIPAGYAMATHLLIYDVHRGINGFTSQPMPAAVTGYPPEMISLFRAQASIFARESFGDEFADELDRVLGSAFDAAAEAQSTPPAE